MGKETRQFGRALALISEAIFSDGRIEGAPWNFPVASGQRKCRPLSGSHCHDPLLPSLMLLRLLRTCDVSVIPNWAAAPGKTHLLWGQKNVDSQRKFT